MSRPVITASIGRVFCMRLHAFYHVPFEDVGSIKPWAAAKGYAIGTTSFFADEAPPPVSDYDMLVVMGGPMGVYDEKDHPWLAGEKLRPLEPGESRHGLAPGPEIARQVQARFAARRGAA